MSASFPATISIIIPARNESAALASLLPELKQSYPEAEIIVVNDGSTDDTASLGAKYNVKIISHPYSIGNGAAIKSGARHAIGEIFIFMDGDGQHRVQDIAPLLSKFKEGYDLVVGKREATSQANFVRWIGNSFYNILASYLVDHPIEDLTSGFRVVNGKKFKEFLYLLPNGFSYPTTITMAFFRSGFSVSYVPITVQHRVGKSHLSPLRDGIRFLLIIYKMAILYSPLKVFFPLAVLHFLAGSLNYAYTYFTEGRFTNMSAVMFSASIIILLMGLLCEQITTLMYSIKNNEDN